MKKVQEDVQNEQLLRASRRLKTDLRGLSAFTNVDLFDSLNGVIKPNKTVYVMDGMITAVVDAGDPVPEEARGIDGTGKSTQIVLLAKQLEQQGLEVVVTREPTDGIYGKKIRKL